MTTQLPLVSAETDTTTGGGCGCGGCGCGGGEAQAAPETAAPETTGPETAAPEAAQPASLGELDVRTLIPRERHETIFATVAALLPGEAFVLVNDHDPKPLRYQLDAEEPGQIEWTYLAEGPEVWRVRIGRVAGHCC